MKNFKKGFTLVEMLIVVVIIGILAATILPRLQGAQSSTRDSAKKTALNQVAQGIELYNIQKGKYPDGMPAVGASISVSDLQTALVPDAMKNLPTNPTKTEASEAKAGDGDSTASAEGSFWLGNVEGYYFLASKVEKAETANWTKAAKIPKDGALCTKVTIGNNDDVSNKANCTITKDNLIYVLPL